MARFKISNLAQEDIIRVHQYGLLHYGEKIADDYITLLFEYFETIASNPTAFEAVDFIKSGYRRCPCKSNTIYYRLTNGVVEIMTIVGAQDLK